MQQFARVLLGELKEIDLATSSMRNVFYLVFWQNLLYVCNKWKIVRCLVWLGLCLLMMLRRRNADGIPV